MFGLKPAPESIHFQAVANKILFSKAGKNGKSWRLPFLQIIQKSIIIKFFYFWIKKKRIDLKWFWSFLIFVRVMRENSFSEAYSVLYKNMFMFFLFWKLRKEKKTVFRNYQNMV